MFSLILRMCMEQEDKIAFLRTRMANELKRVRDAKSDQSRDIHRELARRYEDELRDLGAEVEAPRSWSEKLRDRLTQWVTSR
jgi:hypothetical protein